MWKTVLIVVGAVFALALGGFLVQVASYYRALRSGEAVPSPSSRMSVDRRAALPPSDLTPELRRRAESGAILVAGPADAAITLVEFLDYGCPFCHQTFGPFRSVMGRYSDRVRFVVRDFPLDDLHPRASAAAIAARCAALQGKGWAYHDKLFLDQEHHEPTDLLRFAREVGTEQAAFQTCLAKPDIALAVEGDLRLGIEAGVRGTPTFFLNGIRVEGSLDEQQLVRLLDAALAAPTP
jgi:protein-disulfide isomerase